MPQPNAAPAGAESLDRSSVRRALLRWFERNARDLPWRRNRDPWRVWVSEVLLQQTRVEAIAPRFRAFLRAFPTIGALARASLDRVLKEWEGLGYYARARNLHRAAREIVFERGGRFPRRAAEWGALPGVGPYTAAAVASIAFGEPAPAVDGNVRRVLSRLLRLDPSGPAGRARLDAAARALLPRGRPGDFNEALMDLGATVCVPRRPRCPLCPIERFCAAFQAGDPEGFPPRRRRPAAPHVRVVAAAIRRKDGRLLLGRRPAGAMLGGLWELPGGKVRPGEGPRQALRREILEELGAGAEAGPRIALVEHAYSHFSIALAVHACSLVSGRPRALWHEELRWVSRREIEGLAVPAATRKALARLGV